MPPKGIPIELTRPALLAGLMIVPIVAYYFYRSLVDFPRRQMLLSLAVRSVIIVLLVLSLAGLTLLSPTRQLFVVFAIDRSMSVGDSSHEAVDSFVSRSVAHAGNNRFGFLAFAAEPGEIRPEYKQQPAALDGTGTDIAAARICILRWTRPTEPCRARWPS
jgi:hypothetical protein